MKHSTFCTTCGEDCTGLEKAIYELSHRSSRLLQVHQQLVTILRTEERGALSKPKFVKEQNHRVRE